MGSKKMMILFYSVVILLFLFFLQIGDDAVTVISENQPISRERCIVIDAGHGGEDGGASSSSGRRESTYNLEISLRLNDLLNLLGYKTKMIRTSDISVYTKGETLSQKKMSDLKERVRIVNETENALLLSIHQNNFSDSRYSGAQVFHAGTSDSEQLAQIMQAELIRCINPGSNRKHKKIEGIYLMEHIECTGILIECGFLSNPEEESKLRDETYQKNLCCVIAATVGQYLSNA